MLRLEAGRLGWKVGTANRRGPLLSNIDRNWTRECDFKRFGGRCRLLFEYHPPGGFGRSPMQWSTKTNQTEGRKDREGFGHELCVD